MTPGADLMSSGDAARELGVSARQVRRLVETGALIEVDRVGGTLLLDTASVHRLAARGSQRGRPWSEHVAWAAIDILDDGDTERVSAAQRSRLRARLRAMDAREFVRFARGRADTQRFRATEAVLERLRRNVTLAGESAVAADRTIADAFGLASSRAGGVDGYVERELLDSYVEDFFLTVDRNGNVALRASDHTLRTLRLATPTTVALDLTDSLSSRERSAGLRMLERKLQAS